MQESGGAPVSRPVDGVGLRVREVAPHTPLAEAGLRAGDWIAAVDGLVPRDLIDLQFDLPDARRLTVWRADPGGAASLVVLAVAEGSADASGLVLDEAVAGGIRECTNHCEFCFIRGLPGGLRRTLYVFDDDYRYAFLWGNFLTLTNLDERDWARIGFQRLSPLNVSVHATDPAVRRRLLVNRQAPAILPQLQRLARLGVRVHTQIVLCAGVNDGDVLARSVHDLAALRPAVQSVSVVPVGLTRHSRVRTIRRPTPEEARQALEACEAWQASFRERMGAGFVYPSDELYLLAGRAELPPAEAYDGFPVLSNGVGLVRQMLDAWDRLLARRRRAPPARRVAWLSGRLAGPALERMADRWADFAGWRPDVHVVDNGFFGEQVTVSGLLAGVDLIDALRRLPGDVEDVVLPRGAFGFDGQHTLDGIAAEEVGAAHPGRVHLASTPAELLAILTSGQGSVASGR